MEGGCYFLSADLRGSLVQGESGHAGLGCVVVEGCGPLERRSVLGRGSVVDDVDQTHTHTLVRADRPGSLGFGLIGMFDGVLLRNVAPQQGTKGGNSPRLG